MSWLIPPLLDPHKFWEPEWGLHLLHDADDPRDKTTAIFGASDKMLEEQLSSDLMYPLFGPKREVYAVCNNGTTATTLAITNAAPPTKVTLVGIDSYAGTLAYSL